MVDDKPEHPSDGASLDRLIRILWIGAGVAFLSLIAAHMTDLLAAVGIGTLIFLASFASGAFLGFLFGVPRVLSNDDVRGAGTTVDSGSGVAPAPGLKAEATGSGDSRAIGSAAQSRILQSNTNLEKISDWLTTLIVGASLTQLYRVNDALAGFENFLSTHARVFDDGKGIHSAGALPVVGPIVLVFGAVCGFLYMYLSTRLVLIRLFYAIERYISGGDRLGGDASRALQAAIRSEEPGGSFVQERLMRKGRATVDDALGVMLDLLYKEAPDRVIEIGGSLTASAAAQRPDYWFYLAAAFGQKLSRSEPNSEDWLSNRDNALDCARRAVALNAAYRQRLWAISDPDSTDNDLAPLRHDATFQRIVGQRP